MVRGKCNCGRKAISEWVIYDKPKKEKYWGCRTMKYCELCKPKQENENFFCIYGKK